MTVTNNIDIPQTEEVSDILIKQNTEIVGNWKTFNVQKAIYKEQAN